MNEVTVYSGPGCFKCSSTVRFLKNNGIPHQVKQLADQDDEFVEKLQKRIMGVVERQLSLPLVVTDTDAWDDLRITKLEELKESLATDKAAAA